MGGNLVKSCMSIDMRQVIQFARAGVTLLPEEHWTTADDSVGEESRLYTVSGLQPAQSYQLRVSAVNDVGEGAASQPSVVVTLPQQRKLQSFISRCLLKDSILSCSFLNDFLSLIFDRFDSKAC